MMVGRGGSFKAEKKESKLKDEVLKEKDNKFIKSVIEKFSMTLFQSL
ncbi:hypothetical protein [Clostridium sardiniense]